MHTKLEIMAETEKEKIQRKEFVFNDTKVKLHYEFICFIRMSKHIFFALNIQITNMDIKVKKSGDSGPTCIYVSVCLKFSEERRFLSITSADEKQTFR